MTWSVESSITATASDNLATTNKLAAKAEEAKPQTRSSKGIRALLIIPSLKPPGVDLGVTPCFRCSGVNCNEFLIINCSSQCERPPVVRAFTCGKSVECLPGAT